MENELFIDKIIKDEKKGIVARSILSLLVFVGVVVFCRYNDVVKIDHVILVLLMQFANNLSRK